MVQNLLNISLFFDLAPGFTSPPYLLPCGLPQSSLLGPILFNMYTTPFSMLISSRSLNHHLALTLKHTFSSSHIHLTFFSARIDHINLYPNSHVLRPGEYIRSLRSPVFMGAIKILILLYFTNQITIISESLCAVSFAPLPQDGLVSVQRVRDAECDRSLMIIVWRCRTGIS